MRLTSSKFGLVSNRKKAWSPKGVNSVIRETNLSNVPSVRYGNNMESTAIKKYKEKMHSLGHQVDVYPSGLIVSLKKPWLGTSPDGIVYDPSPDPPYGLLEVKCP